MENRGGGLLQGYFEMYKSRMVALKKDNSSCDIQTDLSLLLASECQGNTQDTIVSVIGLTTGPLWLLGHFLILTAGSHQISRERAPPWVTWSLLPHCVADVISFVGAVLAMQYFPQIMFAVVVMCVHITAAILLVVYHLWCRTTRYDLHGERLVTRGCSVSVPCFSPPTCCPLSICLTCALVSVVTCSAQVVDYPESSTISMHFDHVGYSLEWWEIAGQTLGVAACLGHWLASGYDVISTYRPSKHYKRQISGAFCMLLANSGYLISVYGLSVGITLHTLPWTAARLGLLGTNAAMLIQTARTARKQERPEKDTDVDESLLSSSSESEASGSNVLWESTWKERLGKTSGFNMASLPKLQTVTPVYPMFSNVGSGRPAQPQYRPLPYDFLQSTDTSCSRTGEQDTEPEHELDLPINLMTVTRNSELRHLSDVTPEARHHRVVQWVQKSSPDEEERQQLELLLLEGRQHSGSFSQTRSVPSVPSSRKNSAIF